MRESLSERDANGDVGAGTFLGAAADSVTADACMQVSWTDPDTLQRNSWPADVLWSSAHSAGVDAAVLQTRGSTQLRSVGACSVHAPGGLQIGSSSKAAGADHARAGDCATLIGAAVLVAGHGLLSPHLSSAPPSVAFGCISACKSSPPGEREAVPVQDALSKRGIASSALAGSAASAGPSAPQTAATQRRSSTCADQAQRPAHGLVQAQGRAQLSPATLDQAAWHSRRHRMGSSCEVQQRSAYSRGSCPAAIITDAQVVPGSSGGGLFAADLLDPAGRPVMLGLVTSNARLMHGNTIPSIGYVLPVAQLRGVLDVSKQLATGEVSREQAAAALRRLDVARPALDRLWGVAGNADAEQHVHSRL